MLRAARLLAQGAHPLLPQEVNSGVAVLQLEDPSAWRNIRQCSFEFCLILLVFVAFFCRRRLSRSAPEA